MEKLVTVNDVRERYGCSRQTARKYIRQCVPYMEKPLATTAAAFHAWELERTVSEPKLFSYKDMEKVVEALKNGQRVVVPRRR